MLFARYIDPLARQFFKTCRFKVGGPDQEIAIVAQINKNVALFLLVQSQRYDDLFIGKRKKGEQKACAENQ